MKKIAVIIRSTPFNTHRISEALRMAVGLTLADNEVMVIFAEGGIHALTDTKTHLINSPSLEKSLSTLKELNCPLIAEKESIEGRELGELKYEVSMKKREEIAEIISLCHGVVPW